MYVRLWWKEARQTWPVWGFLAVVGMAVQSYLFHDWRAELFPGGYAYVGTFPGTPRLDDMLRAMRLGMGPCQGGFCSLRAAGLLERLRPGGSGGPLRPLVDCVRHGNQPNTRRTGPMRSTGVNRRRPDSLPRKTGLRRG